MTRAHALAELARDSYRGHPAARTLLEEAIHAEDEERRIRAAAALTALDPNNPVLVVVRRARARSERGAQHLRAVPRRIEAGPGLEPDGQDAEREPSEVPATTFAPVSVARLYDDTSEQIEWLLDLFLPVGALVVLAAFMKAGKTTLAYAIIATLLRGSPVLGRETRRTKILRWRRTAAT